MGMMDKIGQVLGFVEPVDEVEEPVQQAPVVVQKQERPAQLAAPKSNNVVSFQHPKDAQVYSTPAPTTDTARMVLVEPTRFEESQNIADNLLNRKGVVINIENCDAEIATKIIDFVGGVVYAIDGTIQKISQGIVIAVPANIDIASELKTDTTYNNEEIFAWVTRYNRRGEF